MFNIEVTSQQATQVEVVAKDKIKVFTSNIPLAAGPQGPQGQQGLQGPIGLQGTQGVQGLKGETGNTGLTGATGASGETGATGQQGLQGVAGPQGLVGPSGEKGDQGNSGPVGATGLTGPAGIKGDTGLTGPQGLQGLKGDKGDTGEQGLVGPVGLQGVKGDTGLTGVSGPQGIEGQQGSQGQAGASVTLKGSVANTSLLPTTSNVIGDSYINDADGNLYVWTGTVWHDAGQIVGPEGPAGQSGIQGVKGDTGERGLQGEQGLTGLQGIKGDTGETGLTGATGLQGVQGETGLTGPQGLQGIKGDKGDTGDTGPAGLTGLQGTQGVIGPEGPQGIQGPIGNTGQAGTNGTNGTNGAQGPAGTNGTAATVTVGTTTTGATAAVTNSGTSSAAVLNFVLPTSNAGGSSSLLSYVTEGLEHFNDWLNVTTTGQLVPMLGQTTGTGNNNSVPSTTQTGVIGRLYQSCPNVGKVVMADSFAGPASVYTKTFQTRTRVDTLSNAIDNFVVFVGNRNNHSSAAYNTGAASAFVYDSQLTNAYVNGTGATASPNWQIATGFDGLSASNVSFYNTGIPVDTNFHTFKIVNTPGSGTSMTFDYYYDGNLIYTTTLPTTSSFSNLGSGTSIYKNAGTSVTTLSSDYFYFKFAPTFSRV